ncbi:MAG: glycosyltransferase family 4 protein [Prevotellaceae bacterium]|jgi:glycosyltransferase involved in cell wall biosynthesis|nr:glycosyltransferase family 4 protein [Prevotellaceae bacterium]
MKILEIGTGYTSIPAQMGAATEIVVEELTRSMLNLKQNVSIFDIKDKNRIASNLPIQEVYIPQFFSSTDTKLGIVHKLKRVLYSISLTFKLKKFIRKEKEKIVLHFHNQYNLYFFLKFTSKKFREKTQIVYTVHSYIWQDEWENIHKTVHKKYFQEIFCVQKADKVFVLNYKTREHFTKHLKINAENIFLLPNGVNTNTYYPKTSEKRLELKKKIGLENKIVFFQAGSVCERKNQLTALQLLLPFLKKHSSFVYLYAGGIISSEYHKQIDKFAIENQITKQIIYAGELKPGEKLNNYYNVASAFIFPSVLEGFSLVILEALSAGLPVMVDANNGLKLPDGCLCYNNSEHFLSIVNENILNETNRETQIKKGLNVICEQYSWDTIAQQYINIFFNNIYATTKL